MSVEAKGTGKGPPAPKQGAGPAPTAASPPSPGAGCPAVKGKGKGPPPPPKQSGGPVPKAVSPPGGGYAEGARVEVLAGPQTGKCGEVVKVAGEGKDMRWRVQIDGGGPCTWVDQVRAAATGTALTSDILPQEPATVAPSPGNGKGKGKGPGPPPKGNLGPPIPKGGFVPEPRNAPDVPEPGASASAAANVTGQGQPKVGSDKGKGKGKGPPPPKMGATPPPRATVVPGGGFPEGAYVQLCVGPHAGTRGRVVKVAGEGNDMRWRVELENGGPSTWVDKVKAAED